MGRGRNWLRAVGDVVSGGLAGGTGETHPKGCGEDLLYAE